MGSIRFALTRDGSRRRLGTLSRPYGANSRKGRPNHSIHPTAAKSAAAGDARSCVRALAGLLRCTTYPEPTMGRLQTVCDDGTRVTSTWSPTLGRWDTTVTPPPGQTCTGHLNPRTQQVAVQCR